MNFKISKKYAARATEFKSKEDKVNERISIKLPDLDDDIRDEPEEQSSTCGSKIQQKKRKLGLALDTKSSKCSPTMLIKEMKKTTESNCSSKSTQSSLSYIFAKPIAPKSQKEDKMQKFLSTEGIFQINVGVAFEEYSFSSFCQQNE